MQIPGKSGLIAREITQERVVRVAKGTSECPRIPTEDHPLHRGPIDKPLALYFDRVQRKSIEGVRSQASHTAPLGREQGKTEALRKQNVLLEKPLGLGVNIENLEKLMPRRSLEFGYGCEGPRIDGESYLAYSGQYVVNRDGSPVYSSEGLKIFLDEPGAQQPIVPNFETAQDIQRSDLESIRINGMIRCSGRLYRVQFHGQEPILLTSRNDRLVKELQTKLLTLGIQAQAALARNRLAGIGVINTGLTLPSILPDNDEGQIRTKDQLVVMASWVGEAAAANKNLQRLSQFFEGSSRVEKNELDVMLRDLTYEIVFPDKNRKKFSDAMRLLEKLEERQRRRDAFVLNIKQIYRGLYELGRRCESSSIRSCMEERVRHFNNKFGEFVALPIAVARRECIDELIPSQLKFLADFSNEMLLDCNNLLTDLPPGAPASLAMIRTQEVLKAVLSDHSSTPAQINDAMENLRAARG